MKSLRSFGVAALALALLAGAGRAEVKVEVKNVHLCCRACITAVNDTLKTIDGVKGVCNQKGKTVTLTATDAATIQKAVDALATAGFHGTPDNKDITVKDDSGAEKGKVQKLTLTGVHNCCGACNTAIKSTLKKVEGVKTDTAKAKNGEFEVTGEFDAQDVVKALNAAGFHVKVKK
jgi:periplasmic mercuric ion binding protein